MEKELEIQCPHCEGYTYDEVDIDFKCDMKNEILCNECGETFYYVFEIDVKEDSLKSYKTKEEI